MKAKEIYAVVCESLTYYDGEWVSEKWIEVLCESEPMAQEQVQERINGLKEQEWSETFPNTVEKTEGSTVYCREFKIEKYNFLMSE